MLSHTLVISLWATSAPALCADSVSLPQAGRVAAVHAPGLDARELVAAGPSHPIEPESVQAPHTGSPAETDDVVNSDGIDYYQFLLDVRRSHGSGNVVLRVPASFFDGTSPSSDPVVFTVDTVDGQTDGGTWWTRDPQEIPLPPGGWGGIAGLITVAGFGLIRRRRLRVY